MAGLNVLALLTRLPVPPWRGDQLRAHHQLRRLAQRHRITVCVLPLRGLRAEDVDAVRALGLATEVVPLGLPGAFVPLARASLQPTVPWQVALFDRARARRAVEGLVSSGQFDVIHAQLVRTGPYVSLPGQPPVVLDLVDALSANVARRAERDRGALAWLWRAERRRLVAYERELVTHARVAMVVSEDDRDAIGIPGIRVVPNGVDVDAFPVSGDPRVRDRIVFGGNLGYFPNVDAARWLVEAVLPRVRRTVPTATVRLVGTRPARAVRALAREPGVTVVADVPDMAREIAAAAVAVIPMRGGSGLQNKVLEALAVGTPVVTTTQAARPLGAAALGLLQVADTATDLATLAARVLIDPAPAMARAVEGAAFVRRRFSWDASAEAVEAAWLEAVRMA